MATFSWYKLSKSAIIGNITDGSEKTHYFIAPKIEELNKINQELTLKISTLREENVNIRQANKSLNQAVNIKDSEIAALKKENQALQQDKVNFVNELIQLK